MVRRKKNKKRVAIVFGVAVIAVGVFFGVQFVTKTGFFKVPGVVYYDESLTDSERGLIEGIFTEDVELDKDVNISAYYSFAKPELQAGEYLYNIYVPVTDFYSTETNVELSEPELIFADAYQSEVAFDAISIDELDFQKKLLSINGDYYLDSFESGAVFRVVKFDSEKFEDEILPLVNADFSKNFPDSQSVLTFAQTGVTALSRGMNQKLVSVGGDASYFAANIGDFLSSFDLTHTSNESSFTNYATSENICSDIRFINTLTAIGLDIVELTGNHNQDCGDEAAIQSIDIYEQNGIKMVGGGKTADAAAKPLEIDSEGNKITFLA